MSYLEGMDVLQNLPGATGAPKVEAPPPPKDEEEILTEAVEEEEKEVKEEVETKEEEEEEITTSSEEEELQLSYRPSLKDINKEFPELFKKFPDMRNMYFREAKFSEVFPTIEEAQQAKEELEGFVALKENLSSGKLEDAENFISAINEIGEDTLSNLAINILPALKKKNQDAYMAALAPELVSWVKNLYEQGTRNQNKNMQNAALVAALHYFGDEEVATGKKGIKLPEIKTSSKEDKESTVDKERKAFLTERYLTLSKDISSEYEETMKELILDGLDPDNIMTPYMKNVLVQDVIGRIDKVLAADRSHHGQMSVMWKKAQSSNFDRTWKDKIKSAALSRAKSIMPTIRAKARAEALSTKAAAGSKVLSSTRSGKKEALNTSTSRSENSTGKLGSVDASKIDWTKTSDLDYLQGRITLKS